MNRRFLILLVFFSSLLLCGNLFAQTTNAKLNALLKQAKHDSVKCRILNEYIESENNEDVWPEYNEYLLKIAKRNLQNKNSNNKIFLKYYAAAYNNIGYLVQLHGNNDSALSIYKECLKIEKEIGNLEGQASSLINIGQILQEEGKSKESIICFREAITTFSRNNDYNGLGYAYYNLGLLYDNSGNISAAIDYYNKSIEVRKKINDKFGIAACLNDLALLLKDVGDTLKSNKFLIESLNYYKETSNKQGIATTLNNLGINLINSNPDKALYYFNQCVEIYKDFNDPNNKAYVFNNIGHVYFNKNKLDSALIFYEYALKIRQTIADEKGLAYSYNSMAKLYFKLNNQPKAFEFASLALKIANKYKLNDNKRNAYLILHQYYALKGDFKNAYEMQKNYLNINDTINSIENKRKTIQQAFKIEYEKKLAADSLKTLHEKNILTNEIKVEKKQRIFLYAGLLIVIVFAFFLYNRYKLTIKQKQIIEDKSIELKNQSELADSRRVIAEEQKEVIELKQKEILDSIHYASRIQQAMITSNAYFDKYLKTEKHLLYIPENINPDYFIFYHPKDIVSGDFYWATARHNIFYIITADCTGHGVPGAFMSLLNIGFLNEIIVERNISQPSVVLNEQRKEIIKALNPNSLNESDAHKVKDGMDCVLCAFDFAKMELNFAAANNPLWILRKDPAGADSYCLEEFSADKMPVGLFEFNAGTFTPHTLKLNKGDTVYTFTDGYADQFGGPKNKKFQYKQMKEMFLSIAHLSMDEQKHQIEKRILSWMSETEQVDDILVIGIRI